MKREEITKNLNRKVKYENGIYILRGVMISRDENTRALNYTAHLQDYKAPQSYLNCDLWRVDTI